MTPHSACWMKFFPDDPGKSPDLPLHFVSFLTDLHYENFKYFKFFEFSYIKIRIILYFLQETIDEMSDSHYNVEIEG